MSPADQAGAGGAARAPAAPGEEVAEVCGLTHEGEGVVRGGKTVFVAGALPGERIRLRRSRRRRQHDDGELLEVLVPSPDRVVPRCVHFGICGGCSLQHLAPPAQLAAKEAQLRDTLARLAQLEPRRWLPPLAGPVWAYRRRARLGAKFVHKKGRVVVGFRERAAPFVTDATRCEVLAEPAGTLIAPLAALLTRLSIREQLPQIEVAVADNALALVLRTLAPPTQADRALLREFAAAQRVRLYLQPAGLDSVAELDGEGAPPLYYRLRSFGLELEFSPTDFIQINAAVNEALVGRAVELLELQPDSRVLDLFCGLGNFTLGLARHCAFATGVEGEAALVARARGNAAHNGIANAEFHLADLAAEPPRAAPWLKSGYSHVLLDPPRAGARAVLAALGELAPQRLLYISCHPGSLARDLMALVHEHGFTLEAAGVVDMFPHTAHVESLALLTRSA
ncbi:MAG: 23S rRNA (uracil(1939)-C(5))-methyltransferase RlmD [Steroidobacteraceae bacterium]|jgi:23S rRNA (uracil1939-C5)-methyltransferase